MARPAPELTTERLRLRPLNARDLDAWVSVTADPIVTRFIGGQLLSREETWRRMLATAGAWAMLGYGYWAVEAADGGPMIGHVGFADFERAISPSLSGLPEMGWVFARSAHGRGLASEAVQAALGWADRNLAGREIVAIIDPRNLQSIRVAEKAGFHAGETTTYKDAPIRIFRRAVG